MRLFDDEASVAPRPDAPLADRFRPRDLDELLGQQRIVGPGTALRRAIEHDELRSIVLWGPPGCGKTTLARIIARRTRAVFVPFSAVVSGVKDVRRVTDEASARRRAGGRSTILFVDEIHRFNKSQQDAFLPHVENGTLVLIGATTENPSFEVNAALLSRARVYRMERLDDSSLERLLAQACADTERGLGQLGVELPVEIGAALARRSQGDARAALNVLELAARHAAAREEGSHRITLDLLEDALQEGALSYDRAGEQHFNLISALHKSMRNSDPDASLYWLGRMRVAGEDPLYLARRIVRFASEDVGLADPRALTLAVAARDAVHFIGVPEGELALAEAVLYCAMAPKSNALYRAWKDVKQSIADGASDPPPLAILNAPTGLMRREGYGRDYRYAHDHADAVTDLQCLPDRLAGRRFFRPSERGFEGELSRRLDLWLERRRRLTDVDSDSDSDSDDSA